MLAGLGLVLEPGWNMLYLTKSHFGKSLNTTEITTPAAHSLP